MHALSIGDILYPNISLNYQDYRVYGVLPDYVPARTLLRVYHHMGFQDPLYDLGRYRLIQVAWKNIYNDWYEERAVQEAFRL